MSVRTISKIDWRIGSALPGEIARTVVTGCEFEKSTSGSRRATTTSPHSDSMTCLFAGAPSSVSSTASVHQPMSAATSAADAPTIIPRRRLEPLGPPPPSSIKRRCRSTAGAAVLSAESTHPTELAFGIDRQAGADDSAIESRRVNSRVSPLVNCRSSCRYSRIMGRDDAGANQAIADGSPAVADIGQDPVRQQFRNGDGIGDRPTTARCDRRGRPANSQRAGAIAGSAIRPLNENATLRMLGQWHNPVRTTDRQRRA